jgi:membrane protein YqaA with SNARE-associated domain
MTAAFGQTIGEMSAYMIGYTGSGLAQKNRHYETVHRWVVRWGAPVILVLAIVPFGLFDLAGISAGSLRYPVRRFVPVVLAGKIIKSLIFAYGCAWGAEWVGDFV